MLYDSTYHPIFVDQKNTAMETLHSISIASETGPLALYDGRNRAQNGWFILRTLIPSDKTEGAVVWHIGPNVIPNWTRPPMVAHSEVGYPSSAPKIAVIELDPKFDAPKTAKVLRLAEDGFYKPVFEGPISSSTPWLRYTYAKFDFSAVKDPGLYVIEYAGQRTALFPIAPDVYSRTWQSSLDGFLAVEMDHVSVREGYRLWHGKSHLEDARQEASAAEAPYCRRGSLVVKAQRSSGTPLKFPSTSFGPSFSE